MFFKLNICGENAKLASYIISKHPQNTFERTIGNRGKIEAKFTKYLNEEVTYAGHIDNFDINYLKLCRSQNMDVYVNAEQYSVCPYNLELVDTTFGSVIRGKYNGITSYQFNNKYYIKMKIGPFSLYKMDSLIKSLTDLGYFVESENDQSVLSFIDQDNRVLIISKYSDVSTFIQQIYILCYAYTSHLRFMLPQSQDIHKYYNLCSSWIDQCPDQKDILKRLSKTKSNLETFKNDLQIEDEKFEKLEPVKESRYQTIVSLLDESDRNIIDLGCGYGRLIRRILENTSPDKLIGIDIDNKAINITYSKCKQIARKSGVNLKTITGSIMYLDFSYLKEIDTVILCEVIEHFERDQINHVLDIILKGINPKKFILTTPNKDFNVNFEMKNEMRHLDHKFELTKQEIKDLAEYVKTTYNYNYTFHPEGINEPADTLSFILRFDRIGEYSEDSKYHEISNNVFSSVMLDASGFKITSKTVRMGSSTFSRKVNPRWIISLTPTMSPVDSSKDDFIEHPDDTIEYYHNRGIYDLIAEHKYMGSNATIVATKDKEISRQLFGSDDVIKIYSKNGYDFFDTTIPSENKLMDDIHKELVWFMDHNDLNVIGIEAEILPWCFKAKTMIEKKFLVSGMCSLIHSTHSDKDPSNSTKFLKSLENYNQEDSIRIYPYKLIFQGKFNGRKFEKSINGNYIDYQIQLDSLCRLSNVFHPVKFQILNISKSYMATTFWHRVAEEGGEGIVVKPLHPTAFLPSGRYIQPALKCRTKDYLRLIYGINYLEKDNFEFLRHRRTADKRRLAMQQFELSQKILYSFINRDLDQRLKYIFAFFGTDRVARIDNTL